MINDDLTINTHKNKSVMNTRRHTIDSFSLLTKNAKLPGSEVVKTPSLTRYMTMAKEPVFNGIFFFEPFTDYSFADLKTHCSAFKQNGLPHIVWFTENEDAAPAQQYLADLGYFQPGFFHAMELDLKGIQLPERPNHVDIKRVVTLDDLELWISIVMQVFAPQATPETLVYDTWLGALKNTGLGPDSDIQNYLAFIDGKPQGAAQLIFSQDQAGQTIAGNWSCGVLPEGRTKGVASALATRRIQDALKRGVTHMYTVLAAGALAQGYCQRLGFKPCCRYVPYISPGAISEGIY